MPSEQPPTVLTIAGTDSGGGAGVAADLKSFAANGVHGVFAVTVVTAQNTTAITAATAVGSDLVAAQIDAVITDFHVEAAKTGLLFTTANVEAVAQRAPRIPNLVVDPVLVRRTGEPMLPADVVAAYLGSLFPLALVITPNVAETELLTGRAITDRASASAAAEQLFELGTPNVVVTGLLDGAEAVDFLVSESGVEELVEPRIDTDNVHGTGCSFAATVAARLALGDGPHDAVRFAKTYVARGIADAAEWKLGAGNGPISHFHDRT